ncbi:CsbD family protein [Propionibacteriaceae bacterium Y1685]|uniref:CsbD family protein n=1 Tax=Microlunatus sp. Y1700 TaxID=3418487 RepID=UPI003B8081C6
MGFKDKAEEIGGKIKETVGTATDNKDLEREGEAQQTEAKVKGAADDVKEGFSDAKDRLS